MTKYERFLSILVVAFVAEHIWLVTRPSPPTLDPSVVSCRIVK